MGRFHVLNVCKQKKKKILAKLNRLLTKNGNLIKEISGLKFYVINYNLFDQPSTIKNSVKYGKQ